MNFVNIGECVSRISDESKSNFKHIQWKEIIGFRNIIAHDYFGIDAEEIWQIINQDVKSL